MRKLFFTTLSTLSLFCLWSSKVLAQDDQFGVNDLATAGINLGTKDLEATVAGVVNIALGFLGVLATLLILYGGFIWMTSQGNADKVQKAKLIIISAVIGLVIVVSAYAVSRFVLSSLYNVTEPNPDGGGGGGGGGGGVWPGCDEPANSDEPIICSISPTIGPAGTYITIKGWHFDTDDDSDTVGEVQIGGQVAEIVSCDGKAIWGANTVKVKVPALQPNIYDIELKNDADNLSIEDVPFTFNVIDGVLGPNIACLVPDSASATALPANVVIEGAGFSDITGNLTMTGWDASAGAEIILNNANLNIGNWTETRINFSVPLSALTSQVMVEVAGNSDQALFTVSCASDDDCSTAGSSNCCYNNFCRADSICSGLGSPLGPRISSISPNNGTKDNLITIYGSDFGEEVGVVVFESDTGTVVGVDPSVLNASCADTWTDTYIIIAVPDGAVTGQLSITQSVDDGGLISNGVTFTKNDIVRPGICKLDPTSGQFEDEVDINGLNFGNGDEVFFGDFESTDVSINNNLATAQVPNVVGEVSVTLKSNSSAEISNSFPFTALSTLDGLPIINEISPASGSVGQYITIMGANFGRTQGQVLFDAGGADINGDFDFPEVCSDNFWQNDRIIVKVPDNVAIAPANIYPIRVVRGGDLAQSNDYNFEIINGTPGPQVCDMSPDNGPVGTQVDFFGENFGNGGKVIFYNGLESPAPTIWNNNQVIDASVPVGAQTGLAKVEDATGKPSNSLPFSVGACSDDNYCAEVYGAGSICCPGSAGNSCVDALSCETINSCQYIWEITTMSDQLEVIDHAPDCDGACTNSQVYVKFNYAIDPATFELSDIHVYDPSGADIATAYNLAGGTELFITDLNLVNNTTYNVVVGTTFADINGDSLDAPFTWDFTTGETECAITGAKVSPSSYTSYLSGETITDAYIINGTNSNPSCGEVPIFCENCDYSWSSANPLAPIVGLDTDQAVDIQNNLPSDIDYSDIQGTIVDSTTGVAYSFTDDAIFYMDITGVANPPLKIINRTPDCDGVCSNPIIAVEFNNSIDNNRVDVSKISIYDESNIDVFNNNYTFPAAFNFTVLRLGHPVLAYNQTYRVVLEPGFVYDLSGNTLGKEYSWTFSTGDTECAVAAVEVNPDRQVATLVGQTLPFEALPMANSDCGLIPVECQLNMCTYNWSLSDNSVASIIPPADAQEVSVQNDLLSGIGTTDVNVELTDNTSGVPHTFNDSGIFDIDLSGLTTHDIPEIIKYDPIGDNICTNVSPYIDFSEIMDRASITAHIALYEACATGWCKVAGNFRFSDIELNDDDADKETRAAFESSNLLTSGKVHWLVIDNPNNVISTYGLALNAAPLVATPIGDNNDVGWTFTTGENICQAHSAVIGPSPDWFLCAGRNDCLDDDALATAGNQHEYTAAVYDIAGYLLNAAFLDFDWSLNNNLVSETGDFSGVALASVLGTVGEENGKTTLSVSVQSTVDISSTSDSSKINIFLCENPWPSITGFPWKDTAYNFSTYYCYDSGLAGAGVLPYLPYPPSPNSNSISGVLREYIFTVSHSITNLDNNLANQLGSLQLAEKSDNKLRSSDNWFGKLAGLLGFQKAVSQELELPGACTPASPTNLIATSINDTQVSLQWTAPSAGARPTNYYVERRQVGVDTRFINIANVSAPTTSYIDSDVVGNEIYEYRVWSNNRDCADELSAIPSNVLTVNISASQSGIDIIGIRIMPNVEHLSVNDWFAKFAPNPNAVGVPVEVDGYEALQVGNTVYIAATNINPANGYLYTNIYILAYNIGARAETVEIFNQLVANFKLNINIDQQENVCNNNQAITCSSDFDCPVGDWCESQGLKLRRDTKRLGDLVGTTLSLTEYGNSHKACSNNSLIACVSDNDCPGSGVCDPYYPVLNSGTYLPGLSTSKWPSWTDPFGTTVNMSLPTDPINLFNGCDLDADPDTCWNETANPNEFICPLNSLVYIYKAFDFGRDYDLEANFEYDLRSPQFGIDFATNLYNSEGASGVSAIEDAYQETHLSSSMSTTYCDGITLNAPGAAASVYCGNGIVDVDEECDGGFSDLACDLINGDQNWWNPRIVGCNRPGAISATGELIECTWYEPVPLFTPAQCGGYCGDGTLQPYYEGCEGPEFDGEFICSINDTLFCGTGCQPMCSSATLPDYPAGQCGDGYWSEGVEQCDPTASPDGTSGWDCSLGGSLVCNNDCTMGCLDDIGIVYPGVCGDGVQRRYYCDVYCPVCELFDNNSLGAVGACADAGGTEPQIVEECDYYNYNIPLPSDSNASLTYGCNSSCLSVGGFCDDDVVQVQYQEVCEADTYLVPEPQYSSKFAQYGCASTKDFWPYFIDPETQIEYGACTATRNGWCGDGQIQNGVDNAPNRDYGEECDPGDKWANTPIAQSPFPPLPPASNQVNQYSCQSDCTGRTGGYCGDGAVQDEFGELCDGLNYPDRPLPADSSAENTYACASTCVSDASDGGWCGDGLVQSLFGEGCDDLVWSAPWPGTRTEDALINDFSSPSNQYDCSDCANSGGWCSDGLVQSYEDCDTGWDPAVQIEKDAHLVYIFDMSGSMKDDAQNLCTSLTEVIEDLNENHQDIDYQMTIYVLGDNDNGVAFDPINSFDDTPTYPNNPTFLTADTADDIKTIFVDSNGWMDEAEQVFKALYTDCPLRNSAKVEYLSFYDNASNKISGGVNTNGEIMAVNPISGLSESIYGSCTGSSSATDQFAGRLENWGYAMRRIIEGYAWKSGYQRIVVPVTDEFAYCGGISNIMDVEDYEGGIYQNPRSTCQEHADDWSGKDVLCDAVSLATNATVKTHISPVILQNIFSGVGDDYLWSFEVGQALADDTGGLFVSTTEDWKTQIMSIINASFCDGNGDGFMDCTLPAILP